MSKEKDGVIYVHGKGGNAQEAEHYRPLFPSYEVVGLDYHAETPWEAEKEFLSFFDEFRRDHGEVILIANSIGAFFSLHALSETDIEKAFFISPVVDMEGLIRSMMMWNGTTEDELKERGIIETSFGERLSWEYLRWVREHPVKWSVPTADLYGKRDGLQTEEMIRSFAEESGVEVTVMREGEHWFHTEEQMAFLDHWILRNVRK